MTEDVILMSSSDGRIKAEAARYRQTISRIQDNFEDDAEALASSFEEKSLKLRVEYEHLQTQLNEERIREERQLEWRKTRALKDASKDRDDRLEEEVKDQLSLMRDRSRDAGAEKGREFQWLHGLSFDATYRDRGPTEGKRRVRKRIEALIDHAQGDEGLLLTYYRFYLDYFFPIQYYYEWNPIIVRHGDHVTIMHRWKYHEKLVEDSEEEEEQ